jgi:hypothetical protein
VVSKVIFSFAVERTLQRAREVKPMRTQLAVVVGLGLLLATGAGRLSAHHAFAAEFDSNKPVSFKATVTKVEWVNPHVWIHVDVKQPDGKVEPWAIEGGTPNVLFRRGFTKQSLTAGTEIAIDGYRAKDGTRRANGRDLTFADGRKLFLGSSGTGAPYELRPGQK